MSSFFLKEGVAVCVFMVGAFDSARSRGLNFLVKTVKTYEVVVRGL